MSVETWGIAALGAFFVAALSYLLWRNLRHGQHSKELDERIRTYERACHLTRDALIVIDRGMRVVFANQQAQKLATIHPGDPLSRLNTQLSFRSTGEKGSFPLEHYLRKHRAASSSERSQFHDLRIPGRENALYELEISTVRSEASRQAYDILVLHDQSSEAKLLSLHHIHPLTGMPNQYQALGDITKLTAQGGHRNRFALYMIELDNLSSLRSVLGYSEVDTIVSLTANLLVELQQDDPRLRAYHLHYTNFMLLLRDVSTEEEVSAFFHTFQQHLQERYSLRGKNLTVTYSAGVSLYPSHGTLVHLINSAYGALAKAQERGQGQLILAGEDFQKMADRELQLNSEIERGLEREEFKLYFQPIYEARSQRMIGAEVLLRWHHPEQGIIMPNTFIPIAEQSGIVVEIGQYVIRESLKLLNSWKTFGFPPVRLTFNLSLRELEYPDFIPRLTEHLYHYDPGESQIKIEITEHTSMINPEFTLRKLREIEQLGIGIALDDFGTGYSSFSHLAQFPIEILKIDREFVSDITRNPSHQHIVDSMIKLGHSLGMTVVAEGIESKEDVEMLTRMGADYLQGYYFSKPIPKLEFQYLMTHSS